MRPSFALKIALGKQRAQGMPGARCTRSRLCSKKAQASATTGTPQQPAFAARWFYIPCAMVLTGSFVLFPVTGLSCHRHSQDARCVFASLAPASGRQNHTTSPSATTSLVLRTATAHGKPALRPALRATLSRPPHSGPTSVTTRTPLIGPGCGEETTDLGGSRS